jgi:hypothetical protein
MKSIRFGDKPAHQITDKSFKMDIQTLIRDKLKSDPAAGIFPRFKYLNERYIGSLKTNQYLISVNTFGVKFYLLLTTYLNNNYNIFINRKTEEMILVQLTFPEELYKANTIIEGEVVRNNLKEWLFLISDIILYQGNDIRPIFTLDKRISIIKNILKDFVYNMETNPFKLEMKEYFGLEYIENLYKNYIGTLQYRVSGFYFNCVNNYKESMMYIFPENRDDMEKKDVEKRSDSVKAPTHAHTHTRTLDKTNTQTLYAKNTKLPDIYELYIGPDTSHPRVGYACVPDMKTSQNMADRFNAIKGSNQEYVKVECQYSEKFNKWWPICK